MKKEKQYLTPNPYSRPGVKLEKVTQIIVHWVGNANTSAQANRNYFEGLKQGKKNEKGQWIYASSHYIVGLEGEIIACIPEAEIAYHASEANSYAIGIEVCHPDWEGRFSEEAYGALVELLGELCEKYGLDPREQIRRHYDVTGKDCPRYYVKYGGEWEKLKGEVEEKMKREAVQKIKIELNGKVKEVEGICRDGVNYIKLRDLVDERIGVDYDEERKMAVVWGR